LRYTVYVEDFVADPSQVQKGPTKYLQNKTLEQQEASMVCSETDRHEGMRADRHRDRQTDTETDRKTDRQTDRQRDRQRQMVIAVRQEY
jgi:hypothetical protein